MNRRLPSPSSRTPIAQGALSGREAEIQALMAGGRLPRTSNSPSSNNDGKNFIIKKKFYYSFLVLFKFQMVLSESEID